MDDLERETLDILRMSPENVDRLTDMYVDDDERKLLALGGSVAHGVEIVLNRLADRGLVDGPTGPDGEWVLRAP